MTNTNIADRELVSKILLGEQHAYVKVVKQTERLVAGIITRMIANAADRKDIAQDVYLKVYSSLPKFRFQCRLSTYIAQVTYNTCVHYLEKKKFVLIEDIFRKSDMELAPVLQPDSNELEDAEINLFAKDLSVALATAMQQLTPQYQTLINLYHQEELPIVEIAEILSIPEGTVKNYLFRARKQLKEILLKNFEREDL